MGSGIYIQRLEARMANLLLEESEPDRRDYIREIEQAAFEAGLISGAVRSDNVRDFLIDIFSGNPLAPDLMRCKVINGEMPRNPKKFENLDEIVSALRPMVEW